ncbi:Ff.00g064740.m01.CDS01, partial [Fusarium sp. VM40]
MTTQTLSVAHPAHVSNRRLDISPAGLKLSSVFLYVYQAKNISLRHCLQIAQIQQHLSIKKHYQP